MPRTLVVIPCYNAGRLLSAAVASVRAQDDADVELTVVDDGSTDRETRRILASLDVRVLHKPNGGTASARNHGIRESSADYVLPLDADDRLPPGAVAAAARVLDERPAVGIVTGSCTVVGDRVGTYPNGYAGIDSMLTTSTIPNTSMFRRADWEKVGGYPEELTIGEDWAFWMRLLGLGREVAVIDDQMYEYRVSKSQATNNPDPVATAAAMNLVLRENRDLYPPEWLAEQLAENRMLLAHFRRNYGGVEHAKSFVKRLVGR